MKNIETTKELEVLIPLVKKAGEEIMKLYNSNFNIINKSDDTPQTDGDLLAEEILINGLKEFNYGFISEEKISDDSRFEKDKIWIIDPIDGTKNFIHKNGEFAIMIGLIEKNKKTNFYEVTHGIVYAPALDKFYFALKGKGAYLKENGILRKIEVSKIKEFKEFKATISRRFLENKEKKLLKILSVKEKIQMGSIGVKFGHLAQGLSEISLKFGNYLSEWDTCAPQIIIEEAGGKVTDIYGEKLVYNNKNHKMENGFIASNGYKHDEILKIIKCNF
jgi:3'(2'), 5'-bisphosphate nucleotidase